MDRYDVIVVGSGPGGYIAAIRAAQVGYNVALVEQESSLGGVCLNWGCIPTKALLKTAELLKKIATAHTYGIKVDGAAQVNITEVVAHSRNAVTHLGAGVAFLMKKNGVKLYTGHATALGKGKILVSNKNGDAELAGRHIVLATGSRPRMLQNVDQKLLWTAKDAMVPTEIPKSILIVGSGAIGIEFASFYEALGSKVTIVELQDRILSLEDDSVSSAMGEILQSQGVTVLVNSSVCSIVRSDDGLTAEIKNITTEQSTLVTFDRVCCAIGVIPNSDNVGLENTGVELDRHGFILTDSHCETSEKGLYAIGDVAGQPCLAHKASHEAVICIEGIATREGKLNRKGTVLQKDHIPRCIYSIPQIACVGLTEAQARERGMDIKVGISRATGNGKAIVSHATHGFVKVIIDAATGELLGAHMLGDEVTEMINGFLVGRTVEATDIDFAHTIFPHPTLSELMHSAILAAWNEPLDR